MFRIHNAKTEWKLQIKEKLRKKKQEKQNIFESFKQFTRKFHLFNLRISFVCVQSASVSMKVTTWAFGSGFFDGCLFIFLV